MNATTKHRHAEKKMANMQIGALRDSMTSEMPPRIIAPVIAPISKSERRFAYACFS